MRSNIIQDWVTTCYNRKELVAIEMYLLHVGKPWKTGNAVDDSTNFGVGNIDCVLGFAEITLVTDHRRQRFQRMIVFQKKFFADVRTDFIFSERSFLIFCFFFPIILCAAADCPSETVQRKSAVKGDRESQTSIPKRKVSKQYGNPGGAGMVSRYFVSSARRKQQ